MHPPNAVNRNRAMAMVAGAVCLALAGWIWYARAAPERGAGGPVVPKMWYTTDDGRTWFADAANKVVPFEHQGKPAYRCSVWTCDGGRTKFASHLERLSPAGRRAFAGKDRIDPLELVPGSEEVKSPLTGDDRWIPTSSPQSQSVRMPRCPEGKGRTPEPVWPQ